MKGRKPQPTELKILHGVRKDRINDQTPVLPAAIPDCPGHLDREGAAEWERISQELFAAGLLTQVDRAALAVYCQTWSRWVEATNECRSKGKILKSKGTGNLYRNPWLDELSSAVKQMHVFLVEFGMSPSSRSRVKVDKPKKAGVASRRRA